MKLEIFGVTSIAEVGLGDDVAALILDACERESLELNRGDVVVVTHKIVSKAEGAIADAPDDATRKAIVENEAAAILRRRGELVITETRHGFICANAGVDRSNMPEGVVALLPSDPDRSAHRIRKRLEAATGVDLGVVITDTFGRPWRRGLVDVAIGLSGLMAVQDLRGTRDGAGRILEVTEVAVADEIAAAAELVMGKADGVPVAIVRGLSVAGDGRAAELVRPASEDLFR